MRYFWAFILLLGASVFQAHAYTANCAVLPGGSSCNQCFGFDLEQTNRPFDTFVPRSGLASNDQEWIDLGQSSITGSSYQGMTVSPTGNITSQFNLVDHGTGNSSWVWAQMKSGSSITRGTTPPGINYNSPVYMVKFVTKSYIKTDGVANTASTVTHTECAYYFLKAPATGTCGNNIRENTEQCDDGNKNDLDACTNACRYPVCGNGIREGNEACDDGNSNTNDGCSNTCTAPICGNGVREGSEQCDDGNNINQDRCTNACTNPSGPGAACGNGIREGSEQCDDGNLNNTDACSNQCQTVIINQKCHVQVLQSRGNAPLRTSISCSGQPQGRTVIAVTKNNIVQNTFELTNTPYTFSEIGKYTVHCYPDARDQSNVCRTTVEVGALCGNNVVERGEQCDDGNTFSGDSCDKYCRLAGSTCGNGTLERGEECDDGNNIAGDSCSNICERVLHESGPLDMGLLILGIALMGAGFITYKRYTYRA